MSKKNTTKKCWIATEVKGGWRLKLSYGPRDYNLKGLVLKTYEQVDAIAGSTPIVFIHLKKTKYAPR